MSLLEAAAAVEKVFADWFNHVDAEEVLRQAVRAFVGASSDAHAAHEDEIAQLKARVADLEATVESLVHAPAVESDVVRAGGMVDVPAKAQEAVHEALQDTVQEMVVGDAAPSSTEPPAT